MAEAVSRTERPTSSPEMNVWAAAMNKGFTPIESVQATILTSNGFNLEGNNVKNKRAQVDSFSKPQVLPLSDSSLIEESYLSAFIPSYGTSKGAEGKVHPRTATGSYEKAQTLVSGFLRPTTIAWA
jgi:hypothetical protein